MAKRVDEEVHQDRRNPASRVGKLVHVLFSNRQDARIYYAEAASRFKSAEDKFRREFG